MEKLNIFFRSWTLKNPDGDADTTCLQIAVLSVTYTCYTSFKHLRLSGSFYVSGVCGERVSKVAAHFQLDLKARGCWSCFDRAGEYEERTDINVGTAWWYPSCVGALRLALKLVDSEVECGEIGGVLARVQPFCGAGRWKQVTLRSGLAGG